MSCSVNLPMKCVNGILTSCRSCFDDEHHKIETMATISSYYTVTNMQYIPHEYSRTSDDVNKKNMMAEKKYNKKDEENHFGRRCTKILRPCSGT